MIQDSSTEEASGVVLQAGQETTAAETSTSTVGELAAELSGYLREVMPQELQGEGFLLETWQWIGLAALIFLAVVVDRVVRALTERSTHMLAKRMGGETNPGEGSEEAGKRDLSILRFRRPIGIWCGALVFALLLPALDLLPAAFGVLALATDFVLTVTGVWAFYGLVDVVGDVLAEKASASKNKFDDMLVPLLRRTLKLLVVVIGLVFIASKWTDDLWRVVAGLGLGSVAVAFAARDSIENLFGTFTVLLDKPFAIGDWITMGELDGSVEEVGFRSTRVRTFYNSLITVPNREFISGQVDNMGARRYRRIKTNLSLTYDTPPEKVEAFCEGIRELIRRHPYTRKEYYHVYLNGFGASSLDVLLYCFVRTPDWSGELREKHRLFNDILRLADRLGVSFAFPTQSIHVVQPEDLEHPDSPPTINDGLELGREAAKAVLDESIAVFEGRRPGPVRIGDRDPDGRLDG
ncbi:MAG: mechanosensitive ion channel family protein [Planctomycetota bacterium]|nr:mechanosensitive ion channel family protein [Planctomycetota bacterium]